MRRAAKWIVLGTFVLVLVAVSTAPAVFYFRMFGTSPLSDDPQSWGVFGDFIGGIYNPLISLASLSILGYLTYLVAKQTSADTKRLFMLERRMQAYDEVAKFINPITSFKGKMNSVMSMLPIYSRLPADQGLPYIMKLVEELRGLSSFYPEFYATLHTFNVRYGHLFKYDLNSKEFRDLVEETRRVSDVMSRLVSDYKDLANLPEEQRDLRKLRDLLFPVIVALRKEVETKLD